ncbi:hypothetical protein F4819DRAFT_446314 [Hypoxylon fuscum]|nr:hypothetical protein F4819DRAFT_446314 [Hypoxylon fuscum]
MIRPNEDERVEIAEQLLGTTLSSGEIASLFKAYFNHYESIICPGDEKDIVVDIEVLELQSHGDVLDCAKRLCKSTALARDEITRSWLHGRATTVAERNYVSRAIVNITFMIDCDERDYYPGGSSDEGQRAKWEGNQTFVDFLEKSLLPLQRSVNTNVTLSDKKSLKAWKLAKRHGIRIRGTDNLLEHLVYNPRERTLAIFHHVAYLRAHLRRSKNENLDLGFAESLALKTLPPRLLFETLLSLHSILFPIASSGSKRSISLLRKCIRAQGLDSELLWFEYVRPIPSDFTFKYWGRRLEKLQELTKRPPPRNSLVSWFERHTSERNALTVAIIGLFLTALLGFLGVVVGMFQLVIAWMAWKDARQV